MDNQARRDAFEKEGSACVNGPAHDYSSPRSSVGLEQLPSKQLAAGSSPAEEAKFT